MNKYSKIASYSILPKRKNEFYLVSMDSHPASSSSAHFSSSKLIKLGAGTSGAGGCGTVLAFDAVDELVFAVFFEDVARDEALEGFVLGSSFNHDSKLRSRAAFELSLFELDCNFCCCCCSCRFGKLL